jgi:hypothetical protein
MRLKGRRAQKDARRRVVLHVFMSKFPPARDLAPSDFEAISFENLVAESIGTVCAREGLGMGP